MKKGGQLEWKSRRKLIQNASKLSNDKFGWNVRLSLGPVISATKYNRDNLFQYSDKLGQ